MESPFYPHQRNSTLTMKSASDVAKFFLKLEKLIPLFENRDPNPLTILQRKQLNAWKALLNSSSANGKSRARTHVRRHAREFALKVKKIAGFEIHFLCMVEYAISNVPKITYLGFYQELEGWSRRTQFSKSLKQKVTHLWQDPDKQDFQLQRVSPRQDLDPGIDSPVQTVTPSTSYPLQETEETAASEQHSSEFLAAQLVTRDTISPVAIGEPTMSADVAMRSQESISVRDTEIWLRNCQIGSRSPPNIYNNRIEPQATSYTNESENGRAMPSGNSQGLEMAFFVPPDLLDKFYDLHKASRDSQQHSAILTIPTQDRVGSLILSIPRTKAVVEGDKHSLPVIFNSGHPSA